MEQQKKYKLVDYNPTTCLSRVEALKDFGDVHDGEVGGWVEKEENLSQEGDCWVYNDARVHGNAWVFGSACVYWNAQVSGKAWVYGNARVYEDSWVYGNALVYEDAQIFGDARVYGSAQVFGNSLVSGDARVYGSAQVFGNSEVYGYARVSGSSWEVSPLYIQGTKKSLTTSSYTTISIGCANNTVQKWLENYKEIGKEYNYTDEEIEEYYIYIQLAKQFLQRL